MTSLPPPPATLLHDAALFLDFDGTLVDLAETPNSIKVPAGLPALIGRLAERLDGRVAIVSGRSLSDLAQYLSCAGVSFSGSHGLELRLPDGTSRAPAPPGTLKRARSEVMAFAATREGLIVEDKPAGVALHYRQAPAAEDEVASFMSALSESSGLSLQLGKMVAELRPEGAHKGDAVHTLMGEPLFAGARPVFVGDDLTDEHGFEAAADLGGAGVLVGPPRTTAAHFSLGGVADVMRWLEQACE